MFFTSIINFSVCQNTCSHCERPKKPVG